MSLPKGETHPATESRRRAMPVYSIEVEFVSCDLMLVQEKRGEQRTFPKGSRLGGKSVWSAYPDVGETSSYRLLIGRSKVKHIDLIHHEKNIRGDTAHAYLVFLVEFLRCLLTVEQWRALTKKNQRLKQ